MAVWLWSACGCDEPPHGPGRLGRGRHPGLRPGDRCRARGARRHRLRQRSDHTRRALGDEPTGDDRGHRGAGRRRGRDRDTRPLRPRSSIRRRGADGPDPRRARPLGRAGQRRLGRRPVHPLGQGRVAAPARRHAADRAQRHRDASDHRAPCAAAADRDRGRAGRGGRRWEGRRPVPGRRRLRPRQGSGRAAGLLAGGRAASVRRDRAVGDPRLPALRGDARALRRHGSDLAPGFGRARRLLPLLRDPPPARPRRRGPRRRPRPSPVRRAMPRLVGPHAHLRLHRRRRRAPGLGGLVDAQARLADAEAAQPAAE